MQDILNRLEKWRLIRGLDVSQGFNFNLNTQVSFLFEEIGVEFLRAKTEEEKVDAYCDAIVFSFNGANLLNHIPKELEKYNGLRFDYREILGIASEMFAFTNLEDHKYSYSLIFTFAKNSIENMGYDFKKCMDETLKEIESRTGAFNSESGKWEKFKTDEAKTLWYDADYSKCKIA